MYSDSFNTALIYVGLDVVTLRVLHCRCVKGRVLISTKDEGKNYFISTCIWACGL